MVRRIRMVIAIGVVAVLLGGTAALATPPSGLTSTLQARGSWSRHDRIQLLASLTQQIKPPSSDVAMVRATLAPGGTTGWHDHPGPSVVILAAGTLTISEAKGRGCRVTEVSAAAGQRAFFHPEDVHRFDNKGGTVAEFYITYFAPTATPLLIDAPEAPPGCTAA
jgi:quercetin dioxygenase-like cupin family protein